MTQQYDPSPPQQGFGDPAQQFAPTPGGQTQQYQGTSPQIEAGRDRTLEDGISDEMRVALHDFVNAANVSEWCAAQCLDEGPHMAECIRLCRDVADIATLNMQLLTRDSAFGPEAAELFVTVAEECAQECAQHPHRHCQECAEVLPRAARSTRHMLSSFGEGAPTHF
jgi:hypothetical protein